MPVMEAYRIGMPTEQIATMEQIVDEVDAEFDNVYMLDYQSWGSEDDFWNATHLNRMGAELFTTKLAHDIDSLE
jgi:hypothetical protein